MKFSDDIATVKHARASFRFFTNEVFSHSTDIMKNHEYTGGDFVDMICDWLHGNLITCRLSARDHLKSMSFYSHIMWKLFKNWQYDREIQYFSYNNKMAGYHVAKIKRAVLCNPFFDGIIDNKPSAEQIISFSWPRKIEAS